MDPIQLQHTRQSFQAQAARCRDAFPVAAALCEILGAGPSPSVADIFGRYFRITSSIAPNVPLFLGGLHWLALRGDAPGTARFLPTCGGSFSPDDRAVLAAAAEADLAAHREDVLDFLLTYEPQTHEVRRSAAFLAGALVTVDRFGGGLSVVEAGCGGGLNLWFDRYAYRFGDAALGDSSLALAVATEDSHGVVRRLLRQGMPKVVARYGLDQDPKNLADPAERLALAAFFWPDQAAGLERFRAAAALLPAPGPAEIRRGTVEDDLPALLVAAYNAMPPGNTLFLCDSLLWPYLSDEQQVRMATAIQQLAAQLQPHKPMAWLQAEPFTPGSSSLELRLHTFGWADPEDRAVRKLAEAAPDLAWLRWLE